MAAPTFVKAGTGAVNTAADSFPVTVSATAGNVIVCHVFKDRAVEVPASGIDAALSSNIEDLAATTDAMTPLGGSYSSATETVGSPTAGYQLVWIGRATATGTVTVEVLRASGTWLARLYEFTNVAPGTTLAAVIENSTAGSYSNGSPGTSTTLADTAVTTLGVDRLAVNVVAVNDDNALGSFTGESGGDWTLAADYGTATGTDGEIGLQTAAMAAAGTIDGGTFTLGASLSWGVVGFAFKGTTSDYTPRNPGINHQNPGVLCKAHRAVRRWRHGAHGILVPEIVFT